MNPSGKPLGRGPAPDDALTAVNAPQINDDRPGKPQSPEAESGVSTAGGKSAIARTPIYNMDPSLIDPSPVADRLESAGDPAFEALKSSMDWHGQETPILVRPHPSQPGRYQIASGHRRARAAMALGLRVQAIVRPMSDSELVVTQGIENAVRMSLSFIERALFAKRIQDAGHSRSVIQEAMGADKAEVSRLLTVARGIPLDLAQIIGPAPKVGRARWRLLASLLESPEIYAAVTAAAQNPSLARVDSATRFARLIKLAQGNPHPALKAETWKSASGKVRAAITQTPRSTTVSFKGASAEFGAFVLAQLDELEKQFSLRRQE